MGQPQPPPQGGYVFDRKEDDQERLIRSSEILREFTIEACQRAGLRPHGRAIDIGCGPLGALAVLAEVVGSDGEVVGLDASAEALALARRILNQQGLTAVTLVHAELEAITPPDPRLPHPFDVAFMRRFLVHQSEPVRTFRRVAAIMQPGGRIISHEIPPGAPYPALTPAIPAVQRVDALVHATVKARGGSYDVAHRFPSLCRDAGLRLISQRGFVPSAEPRSLLDMFGAVLRSLCPAMLNHAITTEDEVADLLGQLEDAKQGTYVSAFGNLYIEMVAEVG